jgi:hypothetical protein
VDHRFIRFDQCSDFARESERMLRGGLMTASGAGPGYFNEAAPRREHHRIVGGGPIIRPRKV